MHLKCSNNRRYSVILTNRSIYAVKYPYQTYPCVKFELVVYRAEIINCPHRRC